MARRVVLKLPEAFSEFLQFLREKDPRGLYEGRARHALEQLCQKGQKAQKSFDPGELSTLLVAVCQHSNRRRFPDLLQYGPAAADLLTMRNLQNSVERVRRLIDFVEKVKRTHLVVYLQATGEVPAGDALSAPYLDHEGETAQRVQSLRGLFGFPMDPPERDPYLAKLGQLLATVLRLPRLAKRYSRTGNPMGDYLLSGLCQYVRQTTGSWNDPLLVEILSVFRVPHTESTEALKVWRNRTLRSA